MPGYAADSRMHPHGIVPPHPLTQCGSVGANCPYFGGTVPIGAYPIRISVVVPPQTSHTFFLERVENSFFLDLLLRGDCPSSKIWQVGTHVVDPGFETGSETILIAITTRASRSTCTPRKHYCEMTDNTNIAHVASCTCS